MKKSFFLFLSSFIFVSNVFAQELEPNENQALLKVYVINLDNGDTMPNREISLLGLTNKDSYNGTTGNKRYFEVIIPQGQFYEITFKGILGSTEKSKIEVPNMDGPIAFDYDIKLKMRKSVVLENIYFDSGSPKLKPESFSSLDNFVEGMLYNKKLVVEIQGHTDSDGDEDLNLKLSQQRAESVRNYLISKGVAANRMTAVGYGESVPVATNDTTEGKQKNRRTEVKIISQ
jgi:OmpA-OmpF porin, OOP family